MTHYGGGGEKYDKMVKGSWENVVANVSLISETCDNQTAEKVVDWVWKYDRGSSGIK